MKQRRRMKPKTERSKTREGGTTMQARIERGSTGIKVAITGLRDGRNVGEDNIYDSCVENCCRDLSTNELREIVRQIEQEQLGTRVPSDIPPSYRKMLNEIKSVIRSRGEEPPCYCPCPHHAGSTRPITGARPFSPTRPYFGPDQVRCFYQLRVGQAYYDVHIGGSSSGSSKDRFILTREPYLENGAWWIDGKANGRECSWRRSLADRNIVPYESGQWNASNYIAFAEHQPGCCLCHCCHCVPNR